MNINKISPELLNKVKIQSNKKQEIFVSVNNFLETKNFFNNNKYKTCEYKFANCFSLQADFDDINILSNQKFTNYIFPSYNVQIERIETDLINLQTLTENKFYGQDQTICFIDTGISPHFDFIFPKNRIIKFVDLINDKTGCYDDNGHGTFVSGIASGNGIVSKDFIGIAPLSKIISIKALDSFGNSDTNKILDAMQWIYENHKKFNISIVCMSFGAEVINENDPLSKGAEALWKKGIIVVAAAGNSGPKTHTIKSPGNNPYIITVGALDTSTMNVAEFSSCGPTIYGNKPDLLAPAVNVASCNNVLNYVKMSGTSVAAPIIAGVCAIILSKHPKASNNEIKQFLLSNCKPITGDRNKEGFGYLEF